jgi:hypothetical protein
MTAWLTSLEASTFSAWVRESPSIWAYPTILTLHTVGLGVLVGANWMVDLRVLGYGRAIPLSAISRAFPAMWAGFWVNAITGVMLFAADPIGKGTTTLFMSKLALVAGGVALMIALKRRLYRHHGDAEVAGAGVKAVAACSLAIWIAAIAAGRWMAYASTGA